MSQYEKIDVHCHFLPQDYREACQTCGHSRPDGMPGVPEWNEEDHIKMMEASNITKTIMSISSPGTSLMPGDAAHTRKLTRDCNTYASKLKAKRPTQIGFWASLPLPDVEASLEEIAYALDELNADGIGLLSNYHGTYLGDKALDPVFEELNRRKATVFIHPTMPCMPSGAKAAPMADKYPIPLFEFQFDTARMVINLFLSGTVKRCPNVTFIIPHCAGALPPLIARFSGLAPMLGLQGLDKDISPAWVKARLNDQFYFDTAGFSFPEMFNGLLQHVSADRIAYGSDYPFTNANAVHALSRMHDEWLPKILPKKEDQLAVASETAKKILQRGQSAKSVL